MFKQFFQRLICSCIFLLIGFNLYSNDSISSNHQSNIAVLTIDGAIGPATAQYISNGFEKADGLNSDLIIIQMDTPGGLDRSMRDIVQLILASPIPVITYVFPSGSRAASAGTYILYASHIAAMAPGTNLGAATPVSLSSDEGSDDAPQSFEDLLSNNKTPTESPTVSGDPKMRKAVNDAIAYIKSLADLRNRNSKWAIEAVRSGVSLPANEALTLNVIDIIADDFPDLLDQVNGRTVTIKDESIKLDTTNSFLNFINPNLREKILAIISSPDLAYMLLLAGAYGLFLEFSNPGILIAGISGSIAILIALYALNLFPLHYAGLLLILLGIFLFIGEVITPTFGILTLGGTIAFVIGSFFLIDTSSGFPGISLHLIISFAVFNACLLFIFSRILFKSLKGPNQLGEDSLIGLKGMVIAINDKRLQVSVRGEIWQAKSTDQLNVNDLVSIVGIDGLILDVELNEN